MGLRGNRNISIWKFEDKGNHGVVEISTSRRNKETEKYETDFSAKFVRVIGTALDKLRAMPDAKRVKLVDFEVTSRWDKEKEQRYTNYTIFDIDPVEEYHPNNYSQPDTDTDVEDDPF